MHQSYLSKPSNLLLALEEERPRLVRLATYWTGDPMAAEDVVQETFLVAWRKIDELRDPAALSAWLSGIARNLSLLHLRRRGRELSSDDNSLEFDEEYETIPSSFEFEVELDRRELANLLQQALTLLPADTRAILIQKYVDEASQREIATKLGLSENVVAVRLHRGKLALRKVLANELQSETAAFGLLTADDSWQETRIWCTYCGNRRLMGRLNNTEFVLRCPICNAEPGSYHSQSGRDYPFDAPFKTFRPAQKRFSVLMHDLFQTAISQGYLPCGLCGRRLPLHYRIAHYAPASIRAKPGMHVYCFDCEAGSYESLDGLALNLPQGRAFFQKHPRLHTLPQQEIEKGGVPAIVVSFAGVNDRASYEVIVDSRTYQTLEIHSSDE